MGTIIWVVSEGGNLRDRIAELSSDKGPVVQVRRGEVCVLPSPGLILIECDFQCRFESCSKKFRLAHSYPDIPTCLIRPMLNDTASGSHQCYLGSWLNTTDEQPPEIWANLLANLKKPYYLKEEFSRPCLRILGLQSQIVAAKGKIATLPRLADGTLRSVSWLSKYFGSVTSRSPKAFVNTIRLCHCLWDVVCSDAPIKSIAYEYGYSTAHFSYIFHRRFANWPMEARQKCL
ncbi:MAG TPA: hypothetical protein DIW61_13440 [Candidatus Aminicenantes bacterium]|nr:hypothetical protein [Candidatus Aminicenantes bacterium]